MKEHTVPEEIARPNVVKSMTYQELRKAVECAASYRDQEVYLVVDDEGWSVQTMMPIVKEGAAVIPCKSPGAATARPPVLLAKIGIDKEKPADLLDLKDPAGKELGSADAVFWTAAAVEKFLVPYYASVYGDQAPKKLDELIGILGAVRDPSTDLDGAFAVAHMPKSEYVQLDGGLAVLEHTPTGPVATSISDYLAGKP
jgi:hypothetical protein